MESFIIEFILFSPINIHQSMNTRKKIFHLRNNKDQIIMF
jgi:hypothetical protein